METKEKIERLGYLDNKLWIGKITKAEDEERKRLRKELQEAHALDSVSPSVTGRREQSLPGVDERKPERLTFRDAITKAERQIGFADFDRSHRCYGLLHDVCRVMAEVYMMPPHSLIRINGEDLEAGMVAEVLEEINQEMAEAKAEELMDSLRGATCLKAYLRSSLYNLVFEFNAAEAKLDAQVKRDMGWS